MLKVAVTGGIAGGKTLASNTLRRMGAYIIDADIVAREVVAKGTMGAKLLRDSFGDMYFDEQGELKRRKLAECVFENPFKVGVLNALLHPLIKDEIEKKLSETNEDIVFVIVPLLVESGMHKLFDIIWVIAADEQTRIKRLIERDNISEGQAQNFLRRQISEEDRLKIADTVLYNNGSEEDFIAQIEAEYRKLKNRVNFEIL